MMACDKSEMASIKTQPSQPVEVAIRASHSFLSRTALGDVPTDTEGASQPIEWSVGDTIAVWAKAEGEQNYTLDGQIFKFATYNATYDSSDFKAKLDSPMPAGVYKYGAVYPLPKSNAGVRVKYTLPSVQSGQYDPSLDVMFASTQGIALHNITKEPDEIPWIESQQPNLEFRHMFHLVRIRVPENRLGEDIKQLQIIFPYPVVGDVEFDAMAPNDSEKVRENLSNKITVNLPDEDLLNANGRYVWLHIFPSNLALTENNPPLRIRACSKSGVISKEVTASLSGKTFQRGHITPIALTIPESDETAYKEITFSCPDNETYPNFLGENATMMYVREWPATLKPIKSQSATISSSGNGVFKVKFYYLNNEDYQFNTQTNNAKITVAFDSANASVNHNSFTTALPEFAASSNAYYALPYLFYEDFNCITEEQESYGNNDYASTDRNQDGISLNQCPGWSAARFWAQLGTIRINTRYQVAVGFSSSHYGRLDTPPMSRLKGQVNATINFNAGINQHASSSSYTVVRKISLATHTNSSNPINGVGTGNAQSGSLADFGETKYNSTEMNNDFGETAFNSDYPLHTVANMSINSNTRFCFYLNMTVDPPFAATGNVECNAYIDNIKVSIGGSVKHAGWEYRNFFPNHTN